MTARSVVGSVLSGVAQQALGEGVGDTLDTAALLDHDPSRSRWWFNGTLYTDKATYLAAIGATETGGVYTIGPYVDPAGSNLITNGDFPSATTGWAATNGTIAVVGAKLELTGSGSGSAAASQQITNANNRAIRARGKVTRVSGGPGVFFRMAPGAAGLSPSNYSVLVGTGGVETTCDLLFGAEQPTNYVGISQNGASTGKSQLDDVEAKYAMPFQGMDYAVMSARVRCASMPAASGSDQVLAWWGDDTERNRIKLVWDSAGRLRWIVTYINSEQANIDLGAVAQGDAVDTSFSVQRNLAIAQPNGGVVQQDVAVGMPGVGKMFTGRSVTGETFAGASSLRVQVYGEKMPSTVYRLAGDSYVAGSADLTSLTASLQQNTLRRAFYTGAGGSTLANQVTDLGAHAGFASLPTIWWNGYANGYDAVTANDMARYAAGIASLGHSRYVILTPLQTPASAGAQNTATAALRTALLAAYPNNCYDAQTFVDGLVTPYQVDNTHLTDTAMDLLAADLSSWMSGRGL